MSQVGERLQQQRTVGQDSVERFRISVCFLDLLHADKCKKHFKGNALAKFHF